MIRSTLNVSKLVSRATSRHNGAIRTMAGKEIKFGVEGRAAMLRGVDILADAVQVRFSKIFARRFPARAHLLPRATYVKESCYENLLVSVRRPSSQLRPLISTSPFRLASSPLCRSPSDPRDATRSLPSHTDHLKLPRMVLLLPNRLTLKTNSRTWEHS